jgi:Uma2 family endonuclease
MTTAAQIGMSLDEFMRQYDEQPFELIDGECIPVVQITRSVRISGRLFRYLANYVDEHQLGEVFIEAPFVMKPQKQWVKGSRVPDVLFIRADRLKALAESDPTWELSPIPLVPDLVVEVLSPTDSLAAAIQKAQTYLNDGATLIWIIDPDRRAVYVFTTSGAKPIPMSEEDQLTGGEVIPGFEILVAKLFD